MAEKNIANIRSFGDMDSDVFTAPLGTAKPTGLDIEAIWASIGWLSEDGADESLSVASRKTKVWDGSTGRTRNTGTEKTMTVAAIESNPEVFALFYGSAPATIIPGAAGSPSLAEIEIPGAVGTVARAGLFRFMDGEYTYHRYNTRVVVSERGSVAYKIADDAVRELTFDLLGRDYWITDDPAFQTAA